MVNVMCSTTIHFLQKQWQKLHMVIELFVWFHFYFILFLLSVCCDRQQFNVQIFIVSDSSHWYWLLSATIFICCMICFETICWYLQQKRENYVMCRHRHKKKLGSRSYYLRKLHNFLSITLLHVVVRTTVNLLDKMHVEYLIATAKLTQSHIIQIWKLGNWCTSLLSEQCTVTQSLDIIKQGRKFRNKSDQVTGERLYDI